MSRRPSIGHDRPLRGGTVLAVFLSCMPVLAAPEAPPNPTPNVLIHASRLEAGKFADIIAVQGDPLSDIHVLEHVAFVMKGGAVIRNDIAPAH